MAVEAFKFELFADTLCLHRTHFPNLITLCCKRSFSDSRGRCSYFYEIFGLNTPTPPTIRLHPNLSQVYRRKVEELQKALDEPDAKDEAAEVLRTLIERVIIGPGDDGLEIEIVGEIARMVELGLGDGKKKHAALDERTACSVKVVAGARSHLYRTRLRLW